MIRTRLMRVPRRTSTARAGQRRRSPRPARPASREGCTRASTPPPAGSHTDIPPPPCSWMAMSITCCAMVGTATLIWAHPAETGSPEILESRATKRRAAPDSRAWLIAIRASSERVRGCRRGSRSASRKRPVRWPRLRGELRETASARPIRPHAVMDPARTQSAPVRSRMRRRAEPALAAGHANVVKGGNLAVPTAARRRSPHCRGAGARPGRPACPTGREHHGCAAHARSASGSVRPMNTRILHCGCPTPLDHHFRPLMTISSPSRTAVAAIWRRFDLLFRRTEPLLRI